MVALPRLGQYLLRSLRVKFLLLFAAILALNVTYFFLPYDLSTHELFVLATSRAPGICPPRTWAAGKWISKSPPSHRTDFNASSDAYEFLGLQGCASTREVYWHLAADNDKLWDRFPGVASWKWLPPSRCQIRDLDPEAVVKDLVEHGGWFLVGDSVTENHFFSLSCLLYPHVRATPNYIENPYWDRAWPQNLYLEPSSPLVRKINFPPGFDIASTPLVTFRRVDLLLEPSRLNALYHSLHPDSGYVNETGSLFSDETVYNIPPSEYVKNFTSSLPHGNYATMIVSTGGHWTTSLFAGLQNERMYKDGIRNVLDFFSEAMEAWASEVQKMLDSVDGAEREDHPHQQGLRQAPRKQVVVRAYLPGHENCHNYREPSSLYRHSRTGWYNWNEIREYNRRFEAVLESPHYPNIHFLPIDRPGLLRPDAHSAGDCLHIMTGAGVLEGWTHYIWHYVTVELPGRRGQGAQKERLI